MEPRYSQKTPLAVQENLTHDKILYNTDGNELVQEKNSVFKTLYRSVQEKIVLPKILYKVVQGISVQAKNLVQGFPEKSVQENLGSEKTLYKNQHRMLGRTKMAIEVSCN